VNPEDLLPSDFVRWARTEASPLHGIPWEMPLMQTAAIVWIAAQRPYFGAYRLDHEFIIAQGIMEEGAEVEVCLVEDAASDFAKRLRIGARKARGELNLPADEKMELNGTDIAVVDEVEGWTAYDDGEGDAMKAHVSVSVTDIWGRLHLDPDQAMELADSLDAAVGTCQLPRKPG
jgi:hypothetical protein